MITSGARRAPGSFPILQFTVASTGMSQIQPRYKRAAAPAVLPVSVDELKVHLRIDGNDDDVSVEMALRGAIELLDGWTGLLGRCLIRQQWLAYFPACAPLIIRVGEIISIDTVEVYGASGWTIVPAQDWRWEFWDGKARVVASSTAAVWPAAADVYETVRVTFHAGFGATAEDVPAVLRVLIRMMAAMLYENRGDTGAEAQLVSRFNPLLAPWRRR